MALKVRINSNIAPAYLNKLVGLSGNEDCLYLKITQQSGNVEHCSINVSCFACLEVDLSNKENYADNIGVCINNTCYSFTPTMTGDNFIKQGYDYLKTLPEFEGCEDC